MIRKSLAILVAAAFLAGPAFATTATSSGGGGGGAHSGGGGAGGGHGGGGSGGHSGGGHGAFGGHAHGAAAHAVSARAASHAAGGHHHHHFSPTLVNTGRGNNNFDRDPLVNICARYVPTAPGARIAGCAAGPSKMHIDPATGAPAP